MILRDRVVRLIAASVLGLAVCGCGTSGSNPLPLPEVHFLVTPVGSPANFRVDSIVTGGIRHPSIESQEYDGITDSIDFVVEGANPPYSASFTRTSAVGHEIRVELSFDPAAGLGGDLVDSKVTSATVDHVTVLSAPGPVPRLPALETRVDVCSIASGSPSCLTTDTIGKQPVTDPGAFGPIFSGTIGDAFGTHVITGPLRCMGITCTNVLPSSPTIYFLEGAQESVTAVYTPLTLGQTMVARLYLNGVFTQGEAGATGSDVIIRKDL
jgi:hypothetical protein